MISSPGIGSGLDVQGIVSQLVALEQRPLAQLQTRQVTLNAQLSSFGQISAKVSALQDAAAALAKPDTWTRTGSTTSDSSSVTVTTSASAASGDYSVAVSQLAKAHSLASAGFTDSSSPVGTGRLRIEIGTWTNANTTPTGPANWGFAPKSASLPFDIEIGSGDNTLAGIRNKINAAKAGVTASIVNDSSGARLVIRSNESGAQNALKITEVDAGGAKVTGALAGLTFDKTGAATPVMQQTVAAQDALATINGLNLVSPSNTFKDVAEGMSFTALKVTTADVNLNVAIDTASFKSALNKFTTAYNAINSSLRDLTKFDEASQRGGVLQGDRTALTIQSQLRGLVQGTGGSSEVIKRLSDLGITMQRDGSLATDDVKLTTALADPSEVALAMASTADTPATERGIAALFESFAKAVTGAGGTLTSRSESLSSRVKLNGKEQDRVNARIEQTRVRLLAQYSALDTRLASLSGLNGYISQQITAWNKSTI